MRLTDEEYFRSHGWLADNESDRIIKDNKGYNQAHIT